MFENKDKIEEKLAFITDFFLICFIIGFTLLIITALMYILAFDWIAGIANMLYGIEEQAFSYIYLTAMIMFKSIVVALFLIPFIALKWAICKKCKCNKKK